MRTTSTDSQTPTGKKPSLPHRFLLSVVFFCLIVSLFFGLYALISCQPSRPSESEKRMLQGFPELSVPHLLSGQFMDEMEAYLSDSFPFRDEAASTRKKLIALFSAQEDSPAVVTVDEKLLDIAEAEIPVDLPSSVAESEEEVPLASPPAEITVDASLLENAEFYVEDTKGNRRTVFTLNVKELRAYAEILNLYRKALPEDGSLHFVVPLYTSLIRTVLETDAFITWGSNLEDELEKVIADGVYVYDVLDILKPYIGTERLYPSDDIHWLPAAAGHVADAMLEAQGVPSVGYYQYHYTLPGISDSLYGSSLRNADYSRNTYPAILPLSPVNAYTVSRFTEKVPDILMDRTLGSAEAYLGGLRFGPWRLFDTGFHSGRKAMIITDSFGWSITPYLLPYYDAILYADLRGSCYSPVSAGGGIREYIELYGIDDIYMIYSAYNDIAQVQQRLFSYFD